MRLTFNNDKEFINKITEIVLANISNENFGVDELIKETELTHVVVLHKIKSASQKTISQFICEIRLQKANEILQNESLTSAEVAYKVGFGSPAYFNTCFHDFFGYTPGEAKKRMSLIQENDNSAESVGQNGNSAKIDKKNKKKKTSFYVLMAAAVIIVTGIFSWLVYLTFFYAAGSTKWDYSKFEKSIAVLPFKNLGDKDENQWFTEGIADDIINQLYKVKQLRVVSRTSVEQFRTTTLSTPEIAKKLGVNFLLEGSALQSDGKVHMTVKLIDAINDKLIFSEQYDGDQEDIFKIQSDIAILVAGELQATLTPIEIQAIEKKPVRNEEAFKYYLMGRNAINKKIGEESSIWGSLDKALEYFQKSVSIDPSFPLAYAGLAETYYWMAWWRKMPSEKGFKLAKENAQKALQLNKNLADAHSVMGRVYTYGEWKWEKAREEFLLAISENPSDPFAHAYYSELLDILGDDNAAREQINLAFQFDPTMQFFYRQSINYYFNEGKLKECLEEIRKVEEFATSTPLKFSWTKCYIYDRLNEDSIAVEILKKILKREVPDTNYPSQLESAFRNEGSNGVYKFMLNYLKQDPDYPQYFLAQAYGRLGMKKEAIDCLRKSLEKKEIRLPQVNNDPRCVNIRKEPGFREVIEKLGLGPYFDPNKDFSPVAD